ncbi:MAG: sulfatase-like hydrolase/transferase, partial [Rhizobiaceae bacterium]|nr:sulfatase-like hydrolase/transferase [Rhizobiaceae bacterium]
MKELGVQFAREASDERSPRPAREPLRTLAAGALKSLVVTVLLSAVLVFGVELVARGSLQSTLDFFLQPFRPAWTTIALFALLALGLDAVFGRPHHAQLLIGPLVLTLAWICSQKARYLGDPLYPTDFLYSRQIIELMPLLVRERPIAAVGIVLSLIAIGAVLATSWIYWSRRARRLSLHGRLVRLAVAVPALAFFVSIMDYATFSWTRDRLQIIPIMWDQKENYASNGFALAFAMNVPMAKVTAPDGYSGEAMARIAGRPLPAASMPADRPDVIIVMSESFWDATRLPGVTISPDPIPFIRANASGNMFSPEFGGMTANVEFEALTGFSNAFLPYGSIPYQQYIRGSMPSLATFFRSEGYETTAMHPFGGWFWNRKPVYEDFGFETFLSEERLPTLEKRGLLPSDAALTEQIIRRVEDARVPSFVFAVTLQGHGPYDAGRYPEAQHTVTGLKGSAGAVRAYAEGTADADASLRRLVEWAA